MDFDGSVGDVRSLFFDVDLAVRGKIHRGMRLQWLTPSADGGRGVRQQTRVLDTIVVEDVVVEEGPGGAWVKRYVEGPNAGTRFVARFEAQGPAATRVTMEAYVGRAGFAQGLGKLSSLGLEKAMKRTMGEFKIALQGYEPGRARGAVLDAIAEARRASPAMQSLDEGRRRQLVSALLETACTVASVDEGVDGAERDALRAIVAGLWGVPLEPAAEERMVRTAAASVAKEGAGARCTALGLRLRGLGFARLGLSIAALVAEVSRGLSPAELGALRHFALAAGLDEVILAETVAAIDAVLSGREPTSRISRFV